MKRAVQSLTPEDFAKYRVWRFTGSDTPDETYVTPVRQLPVARLTACIIGGPIHLANRTVLTGLLGNLDPSNPRFTEHFLTLSVFRSDGAIFHLARYHDLDATKRGPSALAAFLGYPLDALFPITYDISSVVAGPSTALRGSISAEPRVRLTRSEIIALAVPGVA